MRIVAFSLRGLGFIIHNRNIIQCKFRDIGAKLIEFVNRFGLSFEVIWQLNRMCIDAAGGFIVMTVTSKCWAETFFRTSAVI
jgi:hypothetical protein